MNGYLICTAPWVVPGDGTVIREGAVVINSDMIVKVGQRDEMLSRWSEADVMELSGAIIPPLVNCHTHLELSCYSDVGRPSPEDSMVDWIEDLLSTRLESDCSDQTIVDAMNEALLLQKAHGVALVGDVFNVADIRSQLAARECEVVSFYEMLAPNKQRTMEALRLLDKVPQSQAVSPHAPYSTSALLISTLKQRSDELGHVFSIHLAESRAEIEFLREKSGPFRKFLEKRKSWDNTIFPDVNYGGGVDYLDRLGVLGEKTLLVHCVHVTDEEIEKLAKKKVKVCICPGSNDFLRAGLVPLEKMLDAGLLPAIGTDSLASNAQINLWAEMKIIKKNHPAVPSLTIVEMATRGGAAALDRAKDFGTLGPGKKPMFLEVQLSSTHFEGADQFLDALVLSGGPESVSWITPTTA